jgi:hypothetical protein
VKKVAFTLVVLCAALGAEAKIGESPELTEKRYGKVLELKPRNDGMEDRKYGRQDYFFRVTFRDGKSVQEIVSPKAGSFPFTDDECLELAANVTGLKAGDWAKAAGGSDLPRRWEAAGLVMTFAKPNLTITSDAFSVPETKAATPALTISNAVPSPVTTPVPVPTLAPVQVQDPTLPLRMITFTNADGTAVTNARVLRVDVDGIMYLLSDGSAGGKVKFEDLAEPVQKTFQHARETARKTEEERLARQKAIDDERRAREGAEEQRLASEKAAERHALEEHLYLIRPIDEFDFPRGAAAEAACKDIVSELKYLNTVLELGVGYDKFSDLLAEKTQAIEKIKTSATEGVSDAFLRRVASCLENYQTSKKWWHEQLGDASARLKALDECYLREYRAQAGLDIAYCTGMATANTNANDVAIRLVAEMIRAEQAAVSDGTRPKSYQDPNVAGLSVEQIAEKLKAKLAVGK